MKNNFGNYVIQKALMLADQATKEALALKIQENIPFLSNKKLKANWSHIIEKCAYCISAARMQSGSAKDLPGC